jgi:hypothetical protein
MRDSKGHRMLVPSHLQAISPHVRPLRGSRGSGLNPDLIRIGSGFDSDWIRIGSGWGRTGGSYSGRGGQYRTVTTPRYTPVDTWFATRQNGREALLRGAGIPITPRMSNVSGRRAHEGEKHAFPDGAEKTIQLDTRTQNPGPRTKNQEPRTQNPEPGTGERREL